jgi:hypothetical protein
MPTPAYINACEANDQTYIADTLSKLGVGWVGVTQIASNYPDAEIVKLANIGVRAVRFNIMRGRSDNIDEMVALATRCHAIAGWHAEFYVDTASLAPHVDRYRNFRKLSSTISICPKRASRYCSISLQQAAKSRRLSSVA